MSNQEPIIINDTDESNAKKIAYVVYGLYLVSFIIPIMPIIVGVAFAYIFENDAQGYLKSHYQYLIRSFWLSLLYFALAGASIIILIGFVLVPLVLVWWLIRILKGLKSLIRNEPIQNPRAWFL